MAGLLAAGGLFVALALFDRSASSADGPRAARDEPAAHAETPRPAAAPDLESAEEPPLDTRAVAPGAVASETSPIEPAPRSPRWSDFQRLREQGVRERDYHELYRDFVRRDPDDFRRGARGVVLGDGPTNEKTALLRAAFELDRDGAQELFRATLSEPSAGLAAEAARLREFSVRYLGERCARDERARELVRDAVWSSGAPLEASLRRRAGGHLAASIGPDELEHLTANLLRERDRTVVQAVLAGLAANPRTEAPPGLAERLGFEADAFRPDPEVR